MKKLNLDTYSIKIASKNNTITISPIVDKINGKFKDNYSNKTCPLSINSYILKNNTSIPELKIENKETSYFYLKPSDYEILKILYIIKEITEETYAGLFFQFNEKSNFLINITYKNNKNENTKIEKIYNSTTIFLNSSFLLNDNTTKNGGNLLIYIMNSDKRAKLMQFKIIEKDTISILQKDALNFGFLTTKTTYQYFYTEVFQGEEGELFLHLKRTFGSLIGKIVCKSEINELNDTSIYTNQNRPNSNFLEYNYHTLKLNFTYENTAKCVNGCFLLITLEQKKYEEDYHLIGFEFTILARFWNYTDYISQIIDIPFNEYFIGNFEKGSISYHYYSLYIPEDATKIKIQIESNYLNVYYQEGRIKINTMKSIGNTKKLDIINEQNEFSLDNQTLRLAGKTLSFAIRPKNYYTDFISNYYFRILYLKENETIYYPIDSNFGNLCKPEYNEVTSKYYCHLILRNNYNDLSREFVISQTIQNEIYAIYITRVFKKNIISEYKNNFEYISWVSKEDAEYYLFKFEFQNGELKNIISAFYNKNENVFLQVYSYQMFFYDELNIKNSKMKNNYTLYSQRLDGFAELIDIHNMDNRKGIILTDIKPLLFSIGPENNLITFYGTVSFMKFKNNEKKNVIREIKSGEAFSQLTNERNFPLYFYVKTKNSNCINIGISLKINIQKDEIFLANYIFNGYILDEKSIQRKINGEYIALNSPINGYYSDTLKIGFLKIKQEIVANNNYILIEIKNLNKNYYDSDFLVEIIAREYNNEVFFLPVNQYILETFDLKNNRTIIDNKYYLKCKSSNDAIIYLSSGFDDININFDKSINITHNISEYGFKKYTINLNNNEVYFNITKINKKRNANYIIRYYYPDFLNLSNFDYIYTFDPNNKTINHTFINNETATIYITYNSINVTSYNK